MRTLFLICIIIAALSMLSCSENDEAPNSWQKSLNLNPGLGVVENSANEYLFHSNQHVVKFNHRGKEIWRISLLEQLNDFAGLSISSLQKIQSGGYILLIHGSKISSDGEITLSLILLDEAGSITVRSEIFSGNNIRGSTLKVGADGFDVSIVEGTGNNDDRLLVITTDSSANIIKESSFYLNNSNYAVSGTSFILNDQNGFLLEVLSKSIDSEQKTNRRLIKLDRDLNESWSVDFGGPAFNEIRDILELSSGDFLLAGTYVSEGWVLKVDQSGNILWDKKYSEDLPGKQFFFDADETELGNIILTGSNNVNGAGADDLWVMNLDANGEMNWQVKHGTPYFDFGRSIIQTHDKGYALAGGSQSSFETPIQMWVLKLNSDGKF